MMSSRREPKIEHVPGCFDIVRRGNIPGISFSSRLAPPPPPQLVTQPVTVQAHVPPQVPQPLPRSVPMGPFNKPPFPAVMGNTTFVNPPPKLPSFQTLAGRVATFHNVGSEQFTSDIALTPGKNYLTIYPYYDQHGDLSVAAWISNYALFVGKKLTDKKTSFGKRAFFAAPKNTDNGEKFTWGAETDDIIDWIKKKDEKDE